MLLGLVGCGTGKLDGAKLNADGWQTDGSHFSVSLSAAPSSPLILHLNLGNVNLSDASILATIQNIGTSEIDFSGVIQDGGLIKVCPCNSGPLTLGSLPAGGCIRIKASPAQASGGTENAAFRLEGLLDLSVTATLPPSTPISSSGLVISSTCD